MSDDELPPELRGYGAALPTDLATALDSYADDPTVLRDAAAWALRTAIAAEDAAAEANAGEETDSIEDAEADAERDKLDGRPEDVPSKASVVTKHINGNDYHYWQWREGEQVKSAYKGPANPTE
ncbi:hypothetical protein [Halomarina pelagica]|uniref:hypothetical protein n=1 Tax=Halomarina pelagica TaxID=2961599 RepID=UPI0020C55934|nr:hypothetical protein [Halomarina sp. BND7]